MMKKRIPLLAAVSMIAVIFAGCMEPGAAQSIKMVNDERLNRSIPLLEGNSTLTAKAQAWAEALASQGNLTHSNLADGTGPGWQALGENLAMAPTVDGAHDELMHSPPHRANMLSGRYSQVGVGVAQGNGGEVYVVQEFGG